MFAEYQHFWWADTTFNAPAASPAFNDTFRGQDDLLKVGFMVDLAAAGCAAAREAAGEVRHRQKLRRLGVKRTSGKLTELS